MLGQGNPVLRAALCWTVLTCCAGGVTQAQEGSGPRPAPPESAAAPAKPAVRLRLPAYYGRVVDAQQRQQIYTILQKYEDQLAQLRLQMEQLTGRRDQEVQDVLSEEQRREIEKWTAEARQRRVKEQPSQDTPTPDKDQATAGGQG